MSFSELQSNQYDKSKNLRGGVFSVFLQKDLLPQNALSIRPELAFLKRGGELTDFITPDGEKANYKLNAKYTDLRVQLAYNFLKADSRIRPYVFVTPTLGFVRGGQIHMEQEMSANDAAGVVNTFDKNTMVYDGLRLKLTDGNMASTFFAVTPGVGIKYQFHTGATGKDLCYLGLEAGYEIGITDTYSSKEHNKTFNMLDGTERSVNGTRKMQGLELRLAVGIPFSIFSKSTPTELVAVPEVYMPQTTESNDEEVIFDNPCSSIEEIEYMVDHGENVKGMTICAINSVNFEYSKSTIKRESYEYLNRVAKIIKKTGASIVVKGHTDNRGSDELNMRLSKDRAIAVVNYLAKAGVSLSKMRYEYFGASHPIATNKTEEGRSQNRRVEFVIEQ